MTGKTLALTDRDRQVLVEVVRLGALTREQVMRLGLFTSKTRANERLKRLTDAGLLAIRQQAVSQRGVRLVYLPGRELANSRDARRRLTEASELFLAHQLGLIDVRIAFERHVQVSRWWSEAELAALSLGVIPDGLVEYTVGGLAYAAFVEYDRGTETVGRFTRKVRTYADLAFSGRFERTFARKYFRVLALTDSLRRLSNLSAAVAQVTDRIVRFSLLSELCAHGPTASIWRRPGANDTETLTAN